MGAIKEHHQSFYLPPDLTEMSSQFAEGFKRGESCRISDLEKIFCWMPGFLGGITGLGNQGKTTLELFLMIVKSIIDKKVWIIWSPEMVLSIKQKDGTVKRSASYIYSMLIHAYTGLNPYKHKSNQMSFEQYNSAWKFMEDHFLFLDTGRDNSYLTVAATIRKLCKEYPVYGWLIDPFKNLDFSEEKNLTKDRSLKIVVDEFKYLAMETNTCGKLILHPRSMSEKELRVDGNPKGPYRVINQYDLLGGSIFDNSLDFIHSYYRPYIHDDPNSPYGSLFCLRQKMQELTNKRGEYDKIYYDDSKNRFYFDGVCPIDGSRIERKDISSGQTSFFEQRNAIKK